MNSVKNPPYVDNITISFEILYTNMTVFSAVTSYQFRGLTTDTLTSCSITFTPATTSTNSTAIVKITPKNAILTGGSIILDFSSNSIYKPVDNSLRTYSNSKSLTYLQNTASIFQNTANQQISIANMIAATVPSNTNI